METARIERQCPYCEEWFSVIEIQKHVRYTVGDGHGMYKETPFGFNQTNCRKRHLNESDEA